jgi:hypothetical protein
MDQKSAADALRGAYNEPSEPDRPKPPPPADYPDEHPDQPADEWPDPGEIAMPERWPTLSDKAVYGLAGECTQLACLDSEADPAAVLTQFLTRFGATIGANPMIRIGDSTHYARLFVAIIGETAKARKGTSEKPVARFFLEAERHLPEDSLCVHRGSIGSGEGVIYAVRDPSEKLDKEGLPEDPGAADKRLLVIDEELAGTLRAAAREGSTASAILRQSWDSGNLGTLTKTTVKASDAHIAVIGHITNYELSDVLAKREIHNGLVNRFLWCGARRPCIRPWPKPMPDDKAKVLAEHLAEAIKFGREKRTLKPTDAAARLWSEIYQSLADDNSSGLVGAVTARAEAQIIRIAAHYALLDKSAVIDTAHLIAAASLWNYCEDTARYVFGNDASDETQSAILRALVKKPLNLSEISRLFGGNVSARTYRTALQTLETAQKIERYQGGRINGGKAPTFFRLIQPSA